MNSDAKYPPGLAKIPEGEEVGTEEDPAGMIVEDDSSSSLGTVPVITSEQYNQYVRSLIKLLVGEKTLLDWLKKGERGGVSEID